MSRFTDKEDEIGKVINGISYFKENRAYLTDDFIKSIRDVFLDTLLDTYKHHKHKDGVQGIKFTIPDSVTKRTEQFLEEQKHEHEHEHLFLKLFNQCWKKVSYMDPKIDKEDMISKSQKVLNIWCTIKNNPEYINLPYSLKRKKYERKHFSKWIADECEVFVNRQGVQWVRGVIHDDGEDTE